MNIDFSFLQGKPINYIDSFFAGWNLHAHFYSRTLVSETQKDNERYWESQKRSDFISTGLLDGWDFREKIVPNEP